MPTSTPRLCPGCRQPCRGRCPRCTPQRRVDIDQARGNSTARGYGSRWRRTIRPAFLRDNPLCVLCGRLAEVPDHWPETRASLVARGVTDPDAAHRLRPLCKHCHDVHGLSYKPWAKNRISDLVTVVAGPPCAGKNTYIREHAQPGDTVVDYDAIMSGLTGAPSHHHNEAYREQAHAIRDDQIAALKASGQRGWIIATAPSAAVRHGYGCPVVLLLPSQPTAITRARNERPAEWVGYVRQWYRSYTADPRDKLIFT